MDVAIPAHRIFQPFFLGKTERSFDLGTHVRLACTPIEIRHEHYGWNLLHQGAISRFQIGELQIYGRCRAWRFRRIHDATGNAGAMGKDANQTLENLFGLRGIETITRFWSIDIAMCRWGSGMRWR